MLCKFDKEGGWSRSYVLVGLYNQRYASNLFTISRNQVTLGGADPPWVCKALRCQNMKTYKKF